MPLAGLIKDEVTSREACRRKVIIYSHIADGTSHRGIRSGHVTLLRLALYRYHGSRQIHLVFEINHIEMLLMLALALTGSRESAPTVENPVELVVVRNVLQSTFIVRVLQR